MGRYADILGTLGAAFGIGKASLDSSALTTTRTHSLPDASGTIALQSYVNGLAVAPDYMTSFPVTWNSASSISVGAGSAWVESENAVVSSAGATIDISGIHEPVGFLKFVNIYLGADGTISATTTSPDTPYFGGARSLPGDTTQRYLCSALMNGNGSTYPFWLQGTKMRYLTTPAVSPFRVLSGGTATTSTSVPLGLVIPPTARIAQARVFNANSSSQVYIGNSDMGAASTSNYMTTARTMTDGEYELLTDASQQINYIHNGTPSSGTNIDILGYEFER